MDTKPQMNADEARIIADEAEGDGGLARDDGGYPLKGVTEKIIGAAFEVHRELGSGFLEKVYETALVLELRNRGMAVATQRAVPIEYKDQPVGVYYADLVVENSVLCEIKATEGLLPVHESQLLHYLKATGITVGLLINFGAQRVQVKRLIRSKR
ncbi:MAG: GxxExxY protein [Dehalococcoidia bacterium]|nr:GxxExxY protein [Dehalococcoidia bacterium]